MPTVDDARAALLEALKGVVWLPARRNAPPRSGASRGATGANLASPLGLARLVAADAALRAAVTRWYERHAKVRIEVEALGSDMERLTLAPVRAAFRVPFSDAGEGLQQVFAVVASLEHLRQKGGLLCVEEPESHLHPRLQQALAELVVEVLIAQPAASVMLETHSEIFLLAALAAAIDRLARNAVGVRWVEVDEDGAAHVAPIGLDEGGVPTRTSWSRRSPSWVLCAVSSSGLGRAMEVELGDALLSAKERCDLTLLGLCAFGLAGRRRVLTETPEVWQKWATGFGSSLQEELCVAWEISARSTTTGSRAARLRVSPSDCCLDVGRLQLPPDEAFNLLARPLRVLLENGRNDRSFLVAFADRPTRTRLEEAESKGWLEFETAGGIGELRVRLEAVGTTSHQQLLRTSYLCDSDARLLHTPSAEAEKVAERLRALETQFKATSGYFGRVLSRRAAENYAPPSAVRTWAAAKVPESHQLFSEADKPDGRQRLANGTGASGSPRRRLLASIALGELLKSEPDVLAVLDMKSGYGNGTRMDKTMWQKLDDFQKAVLNDGFGDSFSNDFYGENQNLTDASTEIVEVLRVLRERL